MAVVTLAQALAIARVRTCLRVLALALAIAAFGGLDAPSAHAVGGRYRVLACNQAGGVNNSWQLFPGDTTFTYQSAGCTLQTYTKDVYAAMVTSAPFWTNGSSYLLFAPSNTTIEQLYFDGYIDRKASSDWRFADLAASDGGISVQAMICGAGSTACSWNSAGWIATPAGHKATVGIRQGCLDGDGSCTAYNGYGVPWTEVQLRGAQVELSDNADPTISGVSGTMLSGWRRGSGQTINWTGTDNSGIRTTVAYIADSGWQIPAGSRTDWGCDYTYTVPCSNRSTSKTVDTTAYTNGAHTMILRAFDASNFSGTFEGVTGLSGNWGDHTQTVYIDNAAPIAPASISDGGGANNWQASTTNVSLSWPAGSDANSGVNSYDVCISTVTSCGGSPVYNANVGNVTSATPAATLAHATIYFACVRTVDNALDSAGNPGNRSGWTCSDGFRPDNVQPLAFTVADGTGADIAYVNASTTLDANWTASSDANSGLLRYDYCVTTSSTGADCAGAPIRAWTSAALATSINASGLPALTNGTTYYVCVRAVDNVSNTRSVCSNGQQVDRTNPSTPTLVSPVNDIGIMAWPALTATYVDPAPATPGTLSFQVCADAACTGVTQSGSSGTVSTGANGSWTPTAANATYWWRARGVDGAGNVSGWSATRLIIVGASSVSVGVDSATQSLGVQVPGSDSTASTIVTVQTNAANGYQLQASDGSNTWALSDGGGHTIADWSGTVAAPTVWPVGTSGYLGVTVRDATGGRLPKWGTGTGTSATDFVNNKYAGLTTVPQVLHSRASYSTGVETVTVTYRGNVASTQAPGAYSGSIDYVVIGLP